MVSDAQYPLITTFIYLFWMGNKRGKIKFRNCTCKDPEKQKLCIAMSNMFEEEAQREQAHLASCHGSAYGNSPDSYD